VTHKIEADAVTELQFVTDDLTDISPVRALTGLLRLYCSSVNGKGQLADLSPLKGMRLKHLHCNHTRISDLAPLRDMKLEWFECHQTKVSDLAPLKGMPLKTLKCNFEPERDAEILRSIKTLETINGQAAEAFWKEVDAKKAGK
jgi:hypothetical protein